MNKHTMTLLGGRPGELRVSGAILIEAVSSLIEGARLATRFAVEGESVRKGPRPVWLDRACDVEITGLTAGSATVALEALTLAEVDESRFGVGGQSSLFAGDSDGHFGEQSAIDIFGRVLITVIEGRADDVVADRALLEGCARFARVSGGGVSGLRLDGLRGRKSPLEVTPEAASRIELLRDETPPPQAARVTGTLDTVSASRPDVVLTLHDGTRVPGRMEQHDLDLLRDRLGREVVVSGMAYFRPNGRLLMFDVESLDEAGPGDQVFQAAPVARRRTVATGVGAAADEASGVAAFFGAWPGDESDAELLEALREIE